MTGIDEAAVGSAAGLGFAENIGLKSTHGQTLDGIVDATNSAQSAAIMLGRLEQGARSSLDGLLAERSFLETRDVVRTDITMVGSMSASQSCLG